MAGRRGARCYNRPKNGKGRQGMAGETIYESNPAFAGMAMAMGEISFFCEGMEQKLTLVTPVWEPESGQNPRFPLVVFVQGSTWTSPDRFFQLPQLCAYAQQGVAVASITHRDCLQGHPFPGYLKDVKAAVRFLRSQAEAFGLDPARVGVMGTSSGGNAALLCALTPGDARYETADYAGFPDSVRAAAACFAPSDLPGMQASSGRTPESGGKLIDIMMALIGQAGVEQTLKAMSPAHEVRAGTRFPAFLLAHGDADEVVPYAQSEGMHRRLLDAGADSRLLRVRGAGHEGSFWSAALHADILRFFKAHL